MDVSPKTLISKEPRNFPASLLSPASLLPSRSSFFHFCKVLRRDPGLEMWLRDKSWLSASANLSLGSSDPTLLSGHTVKRIKGIEGATSPCFDVGQAHARPTKPTTLHGLCISSPRQMAGTTYEQQQVQGTITCLYGPGVSEVVPLQHATLISTHQLQAKLTAAVPAKDGARQDGPSHTN